MRNNLNAPTPQAVSIQPNCRLKCIHTAASPRYRTIVLVESGIQQLGITRLLAQVHAHSVGVHPTYTARSVTKGCQLITPSTIPLGSSFNPRGARTRREHTNTAAPRRLRGAGRRNGEETTFDSNLSDSTAARQGLVVYAGTIATASHNRHSPRCIPGTSTQLGGSGRTRWCTCGVMIR